MNNNRGNNNRRRGRGNNNNRPQGGGQQQQQLNRIDSRARGNAPQLLEKYRKLAQDAHLNGDRVQAEYYLQFADHYFRVLADSRQRQEEQRQRQNGHAPDRWNDRWSDTEDDGLDLTNDGDFPNFDRVPSQPQPQAAPRREDGERRRFEARPRPVELFDVADDMPAAADATPQADEPVGEHSGANRFEGVRADEGEPMSDAGDNPFIRDNRAVRNQRRYSYERLSERPERAERRPRRERAAGSAAAPLTLTLDPSSLPPPIAAAAPAPVAAPTPVAAPAPAPVAQAEPAAAADAAPAPRRRGRPRKNPLPEVAATAD